ncbi:MAG TPA: hypothetical protein VKY91_23720 [Vulgatibacteraceae bacterium]|nr:hypothetical protein [Vulgatibacteraceae bacterium]
MTGEEVTEEWRAEEPRPSKGFRFPWLALAGVLATVVAATTLVVGIGDLLRDDRPPDRLLPLQAAAPPVTPAPTPSPTGTPESGPETTETPERSEPRLYEALLRLRFAVGDGVEDGDVRDDVGIDLTNMIEGILRHPRSSREGRRDDVAYLHRKITTRAREGAIDDDRAAQFHWILSRAAD